MKPNVAWRESQDTSHKKVDEYGVKDDGGCTQRILIKDNKMISISVVSMALCSRLIFAFGVMIFLNKRATGLFKQIACIIEILCRSPEIIFRDHNLRTSYRWSILFSTLLFDLVNRAFLEGERNIRLNKSVNF